MIDEGLKLSQAFDATEIKFHNRSEALAAFKEGREIEYDESGEPQTTYDGERLPLKDALTRFAYDAPDGVVDRRTLPREGAGGGRKGTLSKSDLDLQGKIAFINQFGGEAYERLPSTGVGSSAEVRTKQDALKLPVKERVRRYAADADWFAKLADGPAATVAGMTSAGGAKINVVALDKQRRIRGK